MQKYVENLGYRKLAIIMIIGSVLVLIILLYSAMKALAPSSTSPNPTSSPENSTNSTSNSPDNTDTSGSGGVLKIYKNSLFRVSYPSSLSVSEGVLPDNNSSITFSNDVKNQTIEIQIYDSSTVSLANIIGIFIDSKFNESQMLISGQQAHYFEGSILGLIERVVVFPYNGKIYKIQFSYQGNSSDSNLDKNFSNFISSFKLL